MATMGHISAHTYVHMYRCINLCVYMIKLAHVYTYPTQLASLYALLRHDGVFVVVNQCLLHINTNLQKSGCACSVSVLAAAVAVAKFWKAKRQRGKRI